jgi:hypothetical protein
MRNEEIRVEGGGMVIGAAAPLCCDLRTISALAPAQPAAQWPVDESGDP